MAIEPGIYCGRYEGPVSRKCQNDAIAIGANFTITHKSVGKDKWEELQREFPRRIECFLGGDNDTKKKRDFSMDRLRRMGWNRNIQRPVFTKLVLNEVYLIEYSREPAKDTTFHNWKILLDGEQQELIEVPDSMARSVEAMLNAEYPQEQSSTPVSTPNPVTPSEPAAQPKTVTPGETPDYGYNDNPADVGMAPPVDDDIPY